MSDERPALLPFKAALEAAEQASTPEQFTCCLRDCTERLKAANSASAVDSAYQIMEALTQRMEEVSKSGD